ADAIRRGSPRLVAFGVSDEKAWEVGLACGGTIRVFVEPSVREPTLEAARSDVGAVVATVIETEGPVGAVMLIREDGTWSAPLPPPGAEAADAVRAIGRLQTLAPRIAEAARQALTRASSRTIDLELAEAGRMTVFLEVFARRPRLVIFGGVHIAMALVPLARSLEYRAIVADGREAFLTRERFPDADQLILGWPEEAFERIGLDAATFICVLSHDPKLDDPALRVALRSPAPYIGVIGSRKTQAARRERLRQQGFDEADLARLRGPIGLDLGGRHPAETALAILAEMTAVRYGGKVSRE
ncbi:MAG: XdhC family protein, partial [Gemmatimonadales bacterium]